MNILFVNPSLYSGSDLYTLPKVKSIKDTMAYNFALGFLRNGHSVTLYAAADFRPTETETYDFEVIFDETKYKKVCNSAIPYMVHLRKYLESRRRSLDLVISSEVFSVASLTVCRSIPAEKIILWHELALHQRKFYKLPSKFWYNIVARIFERRALVIPRSAAAGTFIRNYMPRVSEDFVEHGINTDNFVYNKEKKNQFIVVAQLILRKNIPSIIEKFARFIEKYKLDYRLLIVGRGELQSALQAQVDSLKLSGRVVLCGFKSHSELRNLLADSRAMLVDTRQDDNMVSIPEAIACGTPVLTNNVPTTFVAAKGVGVQKEWNEDDLFAMTMNDEMIEKCAAVRKEISNEFLADKMIRLWEKSQNKGE